MAFIKRQELSAKLDELIEFGAFPAFEELMGRLSANAGKGIAKAKSGISVAGKGAAATATRRPKIQYVGSVGTHDVLPTDIPKPGNLAWGGETAAVQSGRRQSGVRSYLGSFNTGAGSQAQAAQSYAQRAGMAQRGIRETSAAGSAAGGGAGGGEGGVTDWWNRQSSGRKLAYGVGGGVAAGYAGASLLSSRDRDRQFSSKVKQVKIFESAEEPIEFIDPRDRNPLGQFEPEGQGGPNPNNMAMVYKQPGLIGSLAKGGALAVTGGALGQVGGDLAKKAGKKGKEILKRFKKK